MDGLIVRRFNQEDADELAFMIADTLRLINGKDYSEEFIEKTIEELTPNELIARSEWMHLYVVLLDEKIVGCGGIGAYWGSETESSLFNIFVSACHQGQGIGRKIIETLEKDEYFLRAKRIEIPASITALKFYQKMGYTFKNNIDKIDEEQLYRLEKYKEV